MTDEVATTGAADTTNDAAATSTQATEPVTATEVVAQQQTEQVKSETEAPQGAPEAYEFTAQEGREFDPSVIAEFSEVAKELNLPQDAAQKVLDKMAPALAARQENAIAAARAEWVASTKADAEIGGDKLAENIGVANAAFEKFGTPELRKLLDDTGLGDHPEVLRWAHRVGKATSNDTFVPGRQNGPGDTSAKSMYSNTEMNP